MFQQGVRTLLGFSLAAEGSSEVVKSGKTPIDQLHPGKGTTYVPEHLP